MVFFPASRKIFQKNRQLSFFVGGVAFGRRAGNGVAKKCTWRPTVEHPEKRNTQKIPTVP